jgi:hypothetical protein
MLPVTRFEQAKQGFENGGLACAIGTNQQGDRHRVRALNDRLFRIMKSL